MCSDFLAESLVIRKLYTGKNNRFPFLDILGYFKNTPTKIPNLEE